ncbi:TPM domain-containing protein, partial [Dietzia sp. CW19]
MIAVPHRPDVTRRARSGTAAAVALLLAFLVSVAGWATPSASAEPPSRLQQQVTDTAGVLGADTGAVESRLAELRSTDDIQLWVTFVDSFDGVPVQQWAQETARLSDLGASDVLLAVAVQDGAYWFESDDQRSDQRIADRDIEPQLADGDWAGAAIAAADGLERQGSGSGLSGGALLAIIAAIVAVVAVILLVSRRRRSTRTARQAESAREIPGDDTARMSALPVDVLDARARAGLVEADQAVDTSTTALDTAAGEFGEMRTRPFRAALDAARVEVAA